MKRTAQRRKRPYEAIHIRKTSIAFGLPRPCSQRYGKKYACSKRLSPEPTQQAKLAESIVMSGADVYHITGLSKVAPMAKQPSKLRFPVDSSQVDGRRPNGNRSILITRLLNFGLLRTITRYPTLSGGSSTILYLLPLRLTHACSLLWPCGSTRAPSLRWPKGAIPLDKCHSRRQYYMALRG